MIFQKKWMSRQERVRNTLTEYLHDAMPVGKEWQAVCCHYNQIVRQNIRLSLHYKDIISTGIESKAGGPILYNCMFCKFVYPLFKPITLNIWYEKKIIKLNIVILSYIYEYKTRLESFWLRIKLVPTFLTCIQIWSRQFCNLNYGLVWSTQLYNPL